MLVIRKEMILESNIEKTGEFLKKTSSERTEIEDGVFYLEDDFDRFIIKEKKSGVWQFLEINTVLNVEKYDRNTVKLVLKTRYSEISWIFIVGIIIFISLGILMSKKIRFSGNIISIEPYWIKLILMLFVLIVFYFVLWLKLEIKAVVHNEVIDSFVLKICSKELAE